VKGYCTKLHNEKLHDLHSPEAISLVINSRTIRQEEHVAGMDEKKYCIDILV
jgi:hypothetical protein